MNETNIRIPQPPENTLLVAETLRELKSVSMYGWFVLLALGLALGYAWSWAAATQWILQAGLLWILVLFETERQLPLNCKAPGTEMYPRLGVANRLTIMRGWLIACTGGFLFQEYPPGMVALAPAVFYAISAIIDRIDGYAARRSGQVSRMGAKLDTVFDALGLAIAPLLAVLYGKIHWSYLSVSFAYYLFQLGLMYRRRIGMQVLELQPKLSRRTIAGFQMGFIAVILFPVFEPPATIIAGFVFMLPVLGGFFLDWLSVSGRFSEKFRGHKEIMERGEKFISVFTQPLARLILAGSILMWLLRYPWGGASSEGAIQLVQYGMAVCGILLMLGVLGRIFALLLLMLLGWHYTMHLMGVLDCILLSTTVWILVLGSGRFSLYTWDEEWVNRYDGA